MYFKNIYFPGFILSAAFLLVFSCNFEATNEPANEITEVTIEELLPGALTQLAKNQSGTIPRFTAIFTQVFDGHIKASNNPGAYRLYPSIFDSYWNWGFYSGSIIQAKTLEAHAQKEGTLNYEAIAKILLAHEFGTLTSQFGDIPYREASLGNAFLFPTYDTQEFVYTEVQLLLDEAIRLIDLEDSLLPGPDDLIYNGNMQLWKKMAYALKARFLLHTSKRHPEHFEEILDIVQNKTFVGMEEQAVFDWGQQADADNPFYKFSVERPGTMKLHEYFIDLMIERGDPRFDKIAVPDSGIDWYPYSSADPEKCYWTRSDARIPIISMTELKFMEAEALLRSGGTTTEISAALKTALAISFNQMEMSTTPYQDFIELHADLSSFSGEEEILTHLIQEAYVAYYGYGFQQVWDNFRRLNLPELIPYEYAGPWEFSLTGSIPVRFLYPEAERLYNADNTQAAIDHQNGALLDTPVWAFE